MKRLDFITLTLAVLFFASCVDAQRTSRITRPCPASTTPASVEVDREGDINITPCSGREIGIIAPVLKVYDPQFTAPSPYAPATTRFSVSNSSSNVQEVPAANSYIGNDFTSHLRLSHTSHKYLRNVFSSLVLDGEPTGTSDITGIANFVASTGDWNSGNPLGSIGVTGIASNVDMAGGSNGFSTIWGISSSARVGSIHVTEANSLIGVRSSASFGYASVIPLVVGVQGLTFATSDFGGSATDVIAIDAFHSNINVDVTNLIGVRVVGPSGTGPFSNSYGLKIESSIDVGTSRWAIHSLSTAPTFLSGPLGFDATYTAGGTTGNQTINKPAFSVNFAAAATSLTVTNSFVTSSASVLICTVQTNDSTMKSVAAVAGSGSVVLHANAAATGETKVYCEVKN